MSTKEEVPRIVSDAVWNGKIVKLTPYVSRDQRIRSLYLHSQGMKEIIELEHGEDDWTQRLWELRWHLEYFVIRPAIDVDYLKPLDPFTKGVYEIRSRRPRPSIRAFGMFIEKDCFLATHFVQRARLGGGRKNYEFHQEVTKTRQLWRLAFPNYSAKIAKSKSLGEFVTGGHDEKLFK